MKPATWLRWRLLAPLVLYACLNPQPDEHPTAQGVSPPGLGSQNGGSVNVQPDPQPVFEDDGVDAEAPQQTPVSAPPQAAADAGPEPLAPDAGPADGGVLVE